MAIKKGLKIAAGAMLFAAMMWGVLAAPGFISNQDSIMPATGMQETRR